MQASDLLYLLSTTQSRRLRVIENLLRGRRTVSTLYWGHRYQLLYLLDLDKRLPRGGLSSAVKQAHLKHWVTVSTDDQPQIRLTTTGQQAFAALEPLNWATQSVWPDLDVTSASQRLALAVQVVSQYAHRTNRYYPVNTDLITRQAVRQWFTQVKHQQPGKQLLTALTTSLATTSPLTAAVTVAGFSGFHQPGLTWQQLADQTGRTPWEMYCTHLEGVVAIAQAARQADSPFFSLLQPVWAIPVTRSAQQTLQEVQQGRSLEQVAIRRHIKLSTVKEHLLEAAIMLPANQFPYERLLNQTEKDRLLAALPAAIDEWEFTALPPELLRQTDFFIFRLLAIEQGKRKGEA